MITTWNPGHINVDLELCVLVQSSLDAPPQVPYNQVLSGVYGNGLIFRGKKRPFINQTRQHGLNSGPCNMR